MSRSIDYLSTGGQKSATTLQTVEGADRRFDLQGASLAAIIQPPPLGNKNGQARAGIVRHLLERL